MDKRTKIKFLVAMILWVANVSGQQQKLFPKSNSQDELYKEYNEYREKELNKIDTILRSKLPIRYIYSRDPQANKAQSICFKDSFFNLYTFNFDYRTFDRCEITSVHQLNRADLNPELLAKCRMGNCYNVEMFNYNKNITSFAIVDVFSERFLYADHYRHIQPQISDRMKNFAVGLVVQHPEIQSALGFKPDEADVIMASTKTSLARSKCERSRHLCVAPTIVHNGKALWAIVDLTDNDIVGYRWTEVGSTDTITQSSPTEKQLQNDYIYDCYCIKDKTFKNEFWELDYGLTSSDGLKISKVKYKGQSLLESCKLVDWHVSYSPTEQFGYSDAVGCPYYSSAVVVAAQTPQWDTITENGKFAGLRLSQVYSSDLWPMPCNYNYEQKYEFYNDGRIRIAAASIGRGCGTNATYRPLFRIHFAGSEKSFYRWSEQDWTKAEQETYYAQTETDKLSEENYLYKVESDQWSYGIQPSMGQFGDGGKQDLAYTYLSRFHKDVDEGELDLPSLGQCCNNNYEQGPEKFINAVPESLAKSDFIVWYVPQAKNDNTRGAEYCWAETVSVLGVKQYRTYPCFMGPMLIPIHHEK